MTKTAEIARTEAISAGLLWFLAAIKKKSLLDDHENIDLFDFCSAPQATLMTLK